MVPGRDSRPPEQLARVQVLSTNYKVLALSLGSGLSLIGGLAFSMIAARFLSKHDYATVRQTLLAYEFAMPLLLLGLPNALYYFLPRTESDRPGILVDNTAFVVVVSLLFAAFMLLGGGALIADRFDNPDLLETLSWLAIYPLLMTPIAAMAPALVIAEKVRALAVYNTITSLSLAGASIVAVLFTRSYEWPVLLRVVVPALTLPLGLYMIFRAFPGPLRLPRWTSMGMMVRYAVPLGFATMLGTITMQLHALIVAALCTPEEFAVYINGAIEIPLIAIVTGSITTVAFADMSTECGKGNRPGALDIFRAASIKSASLLLPTMFFFAVAAEPFILFMYSAQYRDSVVPFLIYLAVLPARIVVFGAAMMAVGLTREILWRSAGDLIINAILCLVFVKWLGYVGAAMGLIATVYLWTIPYNLAKISAAYEVPWTQLLPWRRLGLIALISAGCVLAPTVVFHYTTSLTHFIRLALATISYGIVCGWALYRTGFLPLPSRLASKLPEWMRHPSQ